MISTARRSLRIGRLRIPRGGWKVVLAALGGALIAAIEIYGQMSADMEGLEMYYGPSDPTL